MALAHEAQRAGAVERLDTLAESGAAQRIPNRCVEADVDAADRIGQQDETEQTDLRVVVDLDAGEVGDGVHQRLPARERAFLLRFLR